MAAKTYLLEIVTPEKKAFSDQVDFAVFPGSEGELGILFDHAPLLSSLLPGEVRITRNGAVEHLAVSGGFLEVRKNIVSVITETAERAAQIDVNGAIAEKESAETELRKASTKDEKKAADLRFRKALARMKVAGTAVKTPDEKH
jgi:F-type H+-transporting ATPase subunit epsilon